MRTDEIDSSSYKSDHFYVGTLGWLCSPGWRWHGFFNAETQTMCLVGTMIWVLAQNHHFHLKTEIFKLQNHSNTGPLTNHRDLIKLVFLVNLHL